MKDIKSKKTVSDKSNGSDKDLKEKIKELEESVKRAQADFVNFRRRVADERLEMLKYSGTNELISLLPVFDNFTRAFTHIPEELKDNEWVRGVLHINDQFLDVLREIEVTKMDCMGKKLDVSFHDVMQQIPGEKDVILDVVEDGYMYHDKVLRHAKVIVGDGSK